MHPRPSRPGAVVAGEGFGTAKASGAVGVAGWSTALASRGVDVTVDLAVAAFDVGL